MRRWVVVGCGMLMLLLGATTALVLAHPGGGAPDAPRGGAARRDDGHGERSDADGDEHPGSDEYAHGHTDGYASANEYADNNAYPHIYGYDYDYVNGDSSHGDVHEHANR